MLRIKLSVSIISQAFLVFLICSGGAVSAHADEYRKIRISPLAACHQLILLEGDEQGSYSQRPFYETGDTEFSIERLIEALNGRIDILRPLVQADQAISEGPNAKRPPQFRTTTSFWDRFNWFKAAEPQALTDLQSAQNAKKVRLDLLTAITGVLKELVAVKTEVDKRSAMPHGTILDDLVYPWVLSQVRDLLTRASDYAVTGEDTEALNNNEVGKFHHELKALAPVLSQLKELTKRPASDSGLDVPVVIHFIRAAARARAEELARYRSWEGKEAFQPYVLKALVSVSVLSNTSALELMQTYRVVEKIMTEAKIGTFTQRDVLLTVDWLVDQIAAQTKGRITREMDVVEAHSVRNQVVTGILTKFADDLTLALSLTKNLPVDLSLNYEDILVVIETSSELRQTSIEEGLNELVQLSGRVRGANRPSNAALLQFYRAGRTSQLGFASIASTWNKMRMHADLKASGIEINEVAYATLAGLAMEKNSSVDSVAKELTHLIALARNQLGVDRVAKWTGDDYAELISFSHQFKNLGYPVLLRWVDQLGAFRQRDRVMRRTLTGLAIAIETKWPRGKFPWRGDANSSPYLSHSELAAVANLPYLRSLTTTDFLTDENAPVSEPVDFQWSYSSVPIIAP